MRNINKTLGPSIDPRVLEDIALFSAREACFEMLINKSESRVVEGACDTGNLVLTSDLSLHEILLDEMIERGWTGSFSEEGGVDREINNGVLARISERFCCSIDPLDGTGDFKYGKPNTPSAMGYSSLLSFTVDGEINSGICIRPAHKQVIIINQNNIKTYEIITKGNSKDNFNITLEELPFERMNRVSGDLLVNTRPAYPQSNFPNELFSTINEKGICSISQTEAGGAGDALSKLILGELDLVVSGVKADWKFWDTALFEHAVKMLGGKITTYNNQDLHSITTVRSPDLRHTDGVIASIGCKEAHDLFISCLNSFNGKT